MKICFHSYANKTNFNIKSVALSLASIMRLTATRNWPVPAGTPTPFPGSSSFLPGNEVESTRVIQPVKVRAVSPIYVTLNGEKHICIDGIVKIMVQFC